LGAIPCELLRTALDAIGPATVAKQRSADGERLAVPTLVLYEWWRGPRRNEELVTQEALFPESEALPFESEQADIAARLYRLVERPRGRELDLAIAAQAISRDAALWTLNTADFADLPGLQTLPPD
jgi:predicted nucleic acid-binding protein